MRQLASEVNRKALNSREESLQIIENLKITSSAFNNLIESIQKITLGNEKALESIHQLEKMLSKLGISLVLLVILPHKQTCLH